jgi:ParB family transcriptional regulator, chromosome partitioning protein
MPRRGLGRGMEALIPTGDAGMEGLRQVPVDAISPNPYQPRTKPQEARLEELAASIREHGIIQPLVVTVKSEGDGYQLIAGERRWLASKLAGLEKVPVIVKEAAPQEMLELALVENIQRADLNPLEEAWAYRHLVEEFGLSQTDVARSVGKSRTAVTNLIRLLSAAEGVQQALLDLEITEGHGRALLGLASAEAQEAALKIVIAKRLTVRETEALVQRLCGLVDANEPVPTAQRNPDIDDLEKRFTAALGTRVDLRHGRKKGRVVIHYYSDEEFQMIFRRITGEDL